MFAKKARLFCPTGGIDPSSAPDYLALGNVACVGGSWLTKRGADGKIDAATVTARTVEARKL